MGTKLMGYSLNILATWLIVFTVDGERCLCDSSAKCICIILKVNPKEKKKDWNRVKSFPKSAIKMDPKFNRQPYYNMQYHNSILKMSYGTNNAFVQIITNIVIPAMCLYAFLPCCVTCVIRNISSGRICKRLCLLIVLFIWIVNIPMITMFSCFHL